MNIPLKLDSVYYLVLLGSVSLYQFLTILCHLQLFMYRGTTQNRGALRHSANKVMGAWWGFEPAVMRCWGCHPLTLPLPDPRPGCSNFFIPTGELCTSAVCRSTRLRFYDNRSPLWSWDRYSRKCDDVITDCSSNLTASLQLALRPWLYLL